MRILDTDKTAKNIARLMKEKGVHKRTMERETGINRLTIYCWMKGNYLPSLYNLVILSGVLNCSLDDIVVYTEE